MGAHRSRGDSGGLRRSAAPGGFRQVEALTMTTRRGALGLIGWALPAWVLAARQRPPQLSTAVAVGDAAIKIIENVWIPMADGSRLAARLFLPRSAKQSPTGAV